MITLKETTADWGKTKYRVPLHTYFVEGTKILGYIPEGTTEPLYFKVPQSFHKRGRTFITVKAEKKYKKVIGSKGEEYLVDLVGMTCTCVGWKFRGVCKHLVNIESK